MPKLRPNVWRSICAVVGELQCQHIRIQPTLTTRLLHRQHCVSLPAQAGVAVRAAPLSGWRRAAMLSAEIRTHLPRNSGRRQPLTFAAPRSRIADDRLAAFKNLDALDTRVFPRAVSEAPREFHLNCESLQQAAPILGSFKIALLTASMAQDCGDNLAPSH